MFFFSTIQVSAINNLSFAAKFTTFFFLLQWSWTCCHAATCAHNAKQSMIGQFFLWEGLATQQPAAWAIGNEFHGTEKSTNCCCKHHNVVHLSILSTWCFCVNKHKIKSVFCIPLPVFSFKRLSAKSGQALLHVWFCCLCEQLNHHLTDCSTAASKKNDVLFWNVLRQTDSWVSSREPCVHVSSCHPMCENFWKVPLQKVSCTWNCFICKHLNENLRHLEVFWRATAVTLSSLVPHWSPCQTVLHCLKNDWRGSRAGDLHHDSSVEHFFHPCQDHAVPLQNWPYQQLWRLKKLTDNRTKTKASFSRHGNPPCHCMAEQETCATRPSLDGCCCVHPVRMWSWVQRRNATTFQWSPKACQTWREIEFARQTLCNPTPWCKFILSQPTRRNCLQNHLARQPNQCGHNFCYQKLRPVCQRENCNSQTIQIQPTTSHQLK